MTSGSSQGLFVIVAVVIFGIFVTISYILFQDKLQVGLGTIFEDSIDNTLFQLTGEEQIKGTETEDGYIISKIRTGNGSDITDVWVKAKINSDDTLTIESSNNVGKDFIKGNNGTSKNITGGSLTIPSSINGKKVIGISGFEKSTFTGDFNAKNIIYIYQNAFNSSKFTGDFNAPNVELLNFYAFEHSNFTGKFNAPNIKNISDRVFYESKFTGEFNAPKLESVGNGSFYESKFTGDFNMPLLISASAHSFQYSKFTGEFNAPKLEKLSFYSFYGSKFTGKFNAPNVRVVESNALSTSAFTGEIKLPKLTSYIPNSIKLSDGTYYTFP